VCKDIDDEDKEVQVITDRAQRLTFILHAPSAFSNFITLPWTLANTDYKLFRQQIKMRHESAMSFIYVPQVRFEFGDVFLLHPLLAVDFWRLSDKEFFRQGILRVWGLGPPSHKMYACCFNFYWLWQVSDDLYPTEKQNLLERGSVIVKLIMMKYVKIMKMNWVANREIIKLPWRFWKWLRWVLCVRTRKKK